MDKSAFRGLTIALAGALQGCAGDPALPEPERAVPVAYLNAAPAPGLPRPSTRWWREFGHAPLDRLEEAALANNRELGVAVARIAQAQAQARIAESARYPQLELYAKREIEAPVEGIGLAPSREQWRALNRFQAGFRANYELDLWGRHGEAADGALALVLASVHQRDAVALTLTADVAASYFELLALEARVEVAAREAHSRRRALAALEARMRGGDATALEVSQFRVALSNAETTAQSLTQRRERTFNRLALLAGIAPALLDPGPAKLEAVAAPAIEAGLPSELLCRRPDIRRAEAQLAAARYDVRALRASLLPSFSLTADAGLGSRHLAALTSPASLFVLAAATLAQTVFDGGRRQGQLELARARHLELVQQYAGTLLAALRDVEDALVAVRATEAQHRAQLEALAASRASLRLAERTLAAGAADLIALLDAEQRLHAVEDAERAARFERLRAAIDLFKALGGGSAGPSGDPCAP